MHLIGVGRQVPVAAVVNAKVINVVINCRCYRKR